MLKIENVKVYDLEESIVASGYAMGISLDDFKGRIENLKYWLSFDNFLPNFLDFFEKQNTNIGENTRHSCIKCGVMNGNSKFSDGNYYCRRHKKQMENLGHTIDDVVYTINGLTTDIDVLGRDSEVRRVTVSTIDLPLIFGNNLSISKSQGYLIVNNKTFQSILKETITDDDNMVLDHIDKNGSNNTRENLRLCLFRENMRNQGRIKVNDNITGVNYKSDIKRWVANITLNYRSVYIGKYRTKEEAIKARLQKESEIYGEFSPNVELFDKYNIQKPEISHLPVENYDLMLAIKDFKRILKLNKASKTSDVKCHDNWLTGVRVSFDLIYPQYISPELQRYHWIDIVTSSSKMHRLTKMSLKNSCNEYVTNEIIEKVQGYIDEYNADPTYESFMKVLSNTPLGLQLFEHIDTNYKQLQTIYFQRKHHKLKEDWGAFIEFIENLPYAKEFIIGETNND